MAASGRPLQIAEAASSLPRYCRPVGRAISGRVAAPARPRARIAVHLVCRASLLLVLCSAADKPLAALERTPPPRRLTFGAAAPAAVALSRALMGTIGCGERGWCAELLPEHFADDGNGFARRAAPYVGKAPPVPIGQQRKPRSAALPLSVDWLPFLSVCKHYVFAIKEAGALKPTKFGTDCAALAESWDGDGHGFPVKWPSLPGVPLTWRHTSDPAAHLVILLTDIGWLAAGSDLLRMDGTVQARLVFDRVAIAGLRAVSGLGPVARAARDDLLATRYRADGHGGATAAPVAPTQSPVTAPVAPLVSKRSFS